MNLPRLTTQEIDHIKVYCGVRGVVVTLTHEEYQVCDDTTQKVLARCNDLSDAYRAAWGIAYYRPAPSVRIEAPTIISLF